MQRTPRNVPKSVIDMQSCCSSWMKPIAFFFFDVLVTIAVVVAVVVFKLLIKAWTAHLTKNSWIPFWLPSFLSCCHFELGVNFLCRFVLFLSVSPFLIGQALWVASRFTPLMTQQLLARWVECVEFPPGVLNRILCGEVPPRDPTPYINYPFTYHLWQKRLPLLYTFCWQMVPLLHTYVL